MFRVLLIIAVAALAGCKDADTHWRERTRAQVAELLAGDSDLLVCPHPIVLAEVASDAFAASKVTDVFLMGDVSSPKFRVLAKFPNLKSVHIYDTQGTDLLLETIKGSLSIDDLEIETCDMTKNGLTHIAGLSQLERLGIESYGDKLTESDLLKLATLVNLRELTMLLGPSSCNIDELNKQLPQCNISVTIGDITATIDN